VTGAPDLPAGFADTFTSRYVDAGDVRLHAVVGGDGPPLLLVHGWPETWYAWRLLMPALARDFQVVAVDQRGIGLSDKPEDGYDTATLANDMVAAMDALGHERFAVVGCDTGLLIAYAVAADHPDRVDHLVVGEAPIPGVSAPRAAVPARPGQGPALAHPVQPAGHRERAARHRAGGHLLRGRVSASARKEKLPDDAVRYYVDTLATSPEHLRGSFQMYRAFNASAAQNEQRANTRLTMPVLALAGAESSGRMVEDTMELVADDVQSRIFDTGHWIAEQAPDQMLEALTGFLSPTRVSS
jgi:pimeloyl-ACP methyl ester carboxylesterase